MKKAMSVIDLDEEFNHVLNFVKKKWKTNNDIESILKISWKRGIQVSESFQFIQRESGLSLPILKMDFRNNLISKEKRSDAFSGHKPYMLHQYFSNFNDERENNLKIDIISEYAEIKRNIKNNFKKYHENKPIGWIKFFRNYESSYDHGENEEEFQNEFEGHQVVKIQGSYMFPTSTTLPNLAYRHERDETHPLFYLSQAVFSHAFYSNSFNISYNIADAFRTIHEHFSQPEYHDQLVPFFDFSKIVNNQFIFDLEKSLPAPVTEEDRIKSQEEFDRLSPEEKDNRIKKDKEELKDFFSSLMDNISKKLEP